MASSITHFVVGAALALPAVRSPGIRAVLRPAWKIPFTCGLLAVAPDLDVYPMLTLGVPYGSFFGHRGFFHSPFFLILLSFALARVIARCSVGPVGLLWAGASITHPLLDMLTDGGIGVMLLFPVSDVRLFFPWRPIQVSPLGVASFFSRAGDILKSELPFCLASIAIGVLGFLAPRGFPHLRSRLRDDS